MHISFLKILSLIITISFISCSTGGKVTSQKQIHISQQVFWKELKSLCGKSFTGVVQHAPANDTLFKNKILVMHVRSCTEKTIQIPFTVGDNRSRTWVLNLLPNSIELKHDHRHQDGTSDSITLYGGITPNSGSPRLQVFPADQHTVNILPAAATNVWWIDLMPGKYFTYNLRRMGSDRIISIKFDLNKESETPPAPWGW